MTLSEVNKLDAYDYSTNDLDRELYIIDKYGIVHHVKGGFMVMRSNGQAMYKNGIYLEEGEDIDNTDTED